MKNLFSSKSCILIFTYYRPPRTSPTATEKTSKNLVKTQQKKMKEKFAELIFTLPVATSSR